VCRVRTRRCSQLSTRFIRKHVWGGRTPHTVRRIVHEGGTAFHRRHHPARAFASYGFLLSAFQISDPPDQRF
jgi:hypothetical protein